MESLLLDPSYPALFLVSFLAATLLPLGSEWLLILVLLKGYDPVIAVGIATTGNFLGACTNYLIGLYGGIWLTRKVLRIDEQARMRAERIFSRYGSWSLLFSWLPVIGDPLCLVAGVLKVSFPLFSVLVFIGKLARYTALALFLNGLN
jgi:membrane protein YqaA with SNARE-associated domain